MTGRPPAPGGVATSVPGPGAAAATAAPAPYTLRGIQTMLGVSRAVVTGLIDAGFVSPARGPRNEYRFSFQDVVLLRTAHQLQAARIATRRIVRSLQQLKASLPDHLPLTGLRITAVGHDVVVRDGGGAPREVESGQLLIDFEVAPSPGAVAVFERAGGAASRRVAAAAAGGPGQGDLPDETGGDAAAPAACVVPAHRPAGSPANIEAPSSAAAGSRFAVRSAAGGDNGVRTDHPGGARPRHTDGRPARDSEAADPASSFTHAQRIEPSDPAAAEAAYRQTLRQAPGHGGAWLNLGALLCEAGRCAEAVAVYDQAVVHCPDDALLHFNRAIALEDAHRVADALAAYDRCLALAPGLADAHYNAARLHEQLGHAQKALRHYSAYRRLQQQGS